MAHTYVAQDVSYLSGAAIAFGQAVKLSGDAVVPCSVAGEKAFGIAASVATAAGETVQVTVGGVCKARFGAALTAGANVTVNASGDMVAATSGDAVLGQVALAAGNGEIGSVLVDKA